MTGPKASLGVDRPLGVPPARTLFRFGSRYNPTVAKPVKVRLTFDLRHWAVGMRWERAYSGLSDYLNLWSFHFGVPLLTLEISFYHRPLP